jgi:hypothetical protein
MCCTLLRKLVKRSRWTLNRLMPDIILYFRAATNINNRTERITKDQEYFCHRFYTLPKHVMRRFKWT